jgi:hypothetical protein
MKALQLACKTLPDFEGAKIREFQHIQRPVKKILSQSERLRKGTWNRFYRSPYLKIETPQNSV